LIDFPLLTEYFKLVNKFTQTAGQFCMHLLCVVLQLVNLSLVSANVASLGFWELHTEPLVSSGGVS